MHIISGSNVEQVSINRKSIEQEIDFAEGKIELG